MSWYSLPLASAAPISATLFEGFLPFYHEAHLIAQHIAETEFPWCVDPFDSSKALGNDTFLSITFCTVRSTLSNLLRFLTHFFTHGHVGLVLSPLPGSQCQLTHWSLFCPQTTYMLSLQPGVPLSVPPSWKFPFLSLPSLQTFLLPLVFLAGRPHSPLWIALFYVHSLYYWFSSYFMFFAVETFFFLTSEIYVYLRRRKWQPTPVFLPGKSQGRGSLVGCHLWGLTESEHYWSDLAAAAASLI